MGNHPPAHFQSPLGRAAKAAACKAAKVGAIPARDSISSSIGAFSISRDANTGAGWGFTDPAAAVQLRLRVAVGLQALQRCSGFLNRRARGSTVATHQSECGVRSVECGIRRARVVTTALSNSALRTPLSAFRRPAWLSSDSSSFVNCRAIRPTRVRVSPSAPLSECGVASVECGILGAACRVGCRPGHSTIRTPNSAFNRLP